MSNKHEDFSEEADMMTLTLDDGSTLECEIISIFPVGDQAYIALLPVETPAGYDDSDVLLYRYNELENDEVDLQTIEDDDEFERAADAFDEILDEMEFNSMPEND